jgi:hypothetical protein
MLERGRPLQIEDEIRTAVTCLWLGHSDARQVYDLPTTHRNSLKVFDLGNGSRLSGFFGKYQTYRAFPHRHSSLTDFSSISH